MTRQKSDAQLDAEAATPRLEQAIESLIEDHRALYRADLMLPRLHVSSGETETEDSGARPRTNGHPATWTGLPFTPPFLRYINWRRDTVEEGVRPTYPGQTFPWSTARYAQWAECRRSHREHQGRPEWRGSLCYQLVSFTIVQKHEDTGEHFNLKDACLVLGVTPPRASRTLRQALLYIEAAMERAYRRQTERDKPIRERVGIPWRDGHEKHDIPGMHGEDCPQCRAAS